MMKKRLIKLYAILFVLVVAVGLYAFFQGTSEEETQEQEVESQEAEPVQASDTVDPEEEKRNEIEEEITKDKRDEPLVSTDFDEMTVDEKVDYLLDEMTLEEKIGQMLVIGFESTTVDEHVRQMIEDYHVGGIILYDRNMENPEQVAELNDDLQEMAELPLFISVDQEGGDIVRLRDHVTPIPSQQELGAEGDEEKVRATAEQTGKELSDMGFNVNYAPVLDLSSSDTRSFGEDPELTFQLGRQVIAGLQSQGITATVKHFPGNGRTEIDPHVESDTVEADKLDLESKDIYPFRSMIEEVDHNNFFVMVTHLIYPAYDETYPASVSSAIVTDLLREKLGYDGIVVTDDLEMGAVTELYSFEELGYQSVKAGVDLLLVCHTLEHQKQVFHGIYEAVKNGDLQEEDIDESVERILRFKLEQNM